MTFLVYLERALRQGREPIMTLAPGPAACGWDLRMVFDLLLLLRAVFCTQEPGVPGITDLASHHLSLPGLISEWHAVRSSVMFPGRPLVL